MLGDQAWLFADLVDHAAGGAAAERTRRTAQHFHAVVEGVTVVLGNVANAVEMSPAALKPRRRMLSPTRPPSPAQK
jgi:hypothetical protein